MLKIASNFAKLSTKLISPSQNMLKQANIIINKKLYFSFTSSSNPSQVALMEQVQGKVFQVLRSAAKCDQKKLVKNATFQQLGFDSLDSVELVVAMQQYFGFDIPNEQAEKIQTVQAAINTFFRHINNQVANKVVQKQGENRLDKN